MKKCPHCGQPWPGEKQNGAVPPELRGLELYEDDERLCKRWPKLYPAWQTACPGLDVLAEVRRAHAWEVANPAKKKTDRPRFLTNWLYRQQDRPRPAVHTPAPIDYANSVPSQEEADAS